MRIATRGSALAQWQADHVAALLAASGNGVVCEKVIVSTHGDRRTDLPLSEIGGKGVFVKEVQAALFDGRADIAVHSAKDLPALTPDGLVIAAVPARGDADDVLIGGRLHDLRVGATIATGSARRQAQLAHARPDLHFVGLRGNIETRIAKAVDGLTIVAAAAAIERLGLTPDVVHRLDHRVMLPQVGQGTLAIECRADDQPTRDLLAAITDPAAQRRLVAERSFLVEIGGDCTLPVAAHATLTPADPGDPADSGGPPGPIRVEALISSPDGQTLVRDARTGTDAETVGRELARDLLDEAGGAEILADRP